MSFYQGLPWASFSPTRDTSLGPPPGFGVTTTAALPAVSAPLSPTHDGHASWLPAAAPSAIDSVINRLVSNLSGFQPFIPLGSVPASPVTLVSDHSARASPAASTPEHHSERATSPITASPGDRRWSLTDDDDASNSIRTGQGSPSSIASSSWAKIAVTNVAPGPKALAHFRPLEDDIGVSVEEAIQIGHGEVEGDNRPSEPRPIMHLSGLPKNFTQADVKKMLKALGVRSSIMHFVINRRVFEKTTAEGIRTPLPVEELFLEFKMPEYADILMRAVKPTVAGKVITIERSDATELRVALFPRLRNQSPKDFYPLLSKDEIAALLDFCTRAEASFPADNSLPFEHVCSLLQKFARMDSDKMTDIQRNAVYDLGKLSINALHHKLTTKRGFHTGLQQSLLVKLVVAALTVPTFTLRQKYNVTKESGLAPNQVPPDLQGYFMEPPKVQRYQQRTPE